MEYRQCIKFSKVGDFSDNLYIRYFLIYEIFYACIYKKFIYKSFN